MHVLLRYMATSDTCSSQSSMFYCWQEPQEQQSRSVLFDVTATFWCYASRLLRERQTPGI
jgi:hypothetical protein